VIWGWEEGKNEGKNFCKEEVRVGKFAVSRFDLII